MNRAPLVGLAAAVGIATAAVIGLSGAPASVGQPAMKTAAGATTVGEQRYVGFSHLMYNLPCGVQMDGPVPMDANVVTKIGLTGEPGSAHGTYQRMLKNQSTASFAFTITGTVAEDAKQGKFLSGHSGELKYTETSKRGIVSKSYSWKLSPNAYHPVVERENQAPIVGMFPNAKWVKPMFLAS